jgi:hypothetical protein
VSQISHVVHCGQKNKNPQKLQPKDQRIRSKYEACLRPIKLPTTRHLAAKSSKMLARALTLHDSLAFTKVQSRLLTQRSSLEEEEV